MTKKKQTRKRKRSEGQKATRAPIPLTFNGKKVEVTPLNMRASKAWKSTLADKLAEMFSHAGKRNTSTEDAVASLRVLIAGSDDAMIEVLSAYSDELSADFLEENASSQEAYDALLAIVNVEYPFLTRLGDLPLSM